MDKKKIIIPALIVMGVLIVLLIPYLARLNSPTLPASGFGSHVVTSDEFDREISGLSSDDTLSLSLSFDGETLFHDSGFNTYYYSIVKDSGTAFIPEVSAEIPGMNAGTGKLIFDRSITAEGIEKNEKIRGAFIKDGRYKGFEVVCTTLPLVNIDHVGNLENGKCGMSFSLFDNRSGVKDRLIYSGGDVKYRGASTLYFPKKSLKLSLRSVEGEKSSKNKISLLGMRSDDDWILTAAYSDPEKVREVFNENLWSDSCATDNSWGVSAGIRYSYVELIMNGDYMGLYALGFPIDEKQFGLNKNPSENALYKKQGWDSEDVLTLGTWGCQPGYECKTENEHVRAGYEGEFGIYTGPGGDVVKDFSEWKLLYEHYLFLARNANDSEALINCIDVNNAVDIALFFNLIQGHDTVNGTLIKNEFLAIKSGENGPEVLYAPWDTDISWGTGWISNGDVNFTVPYRFDPHDNFVLRNGYLAQILFNNDTDMLSRMIDRYFELRNTGWSDKAVNELMDVLEADIFDSGAYLREMERWPDATYGDPLEKLGKFREYVNLRLKYADEYYERLKDTVKEEPCIRCFADYADLKSAPFFVIVSDPAKLSDPDLVKMLDRIGADPQKFYEGAIFATGVYGGEWEYFNALPAPEKSIDTKQGTFSLQKTESGEYFYEDEYTILMDDAEGCQVRYKDPDITGIFIKSYSNVFSVTYGKRYEPAVETESFDDDVLRNILEKYGY